MAGSRRAETPDNDDAVDLDTIARGHKPNPSWYVPVMLGLMILGLLWIVVFYLTAGAFPVQAWGNWNLGAGFALIMVGFLMTTNWR